MAERVNLKDRALAESEERDKDYERKNRFMVRRGTDGNILPITLELDGDTVSFMHMTIGDLDTLEYEQGEAEKKEGLAQKQGQRAIANKWLKLKYTDPLFTDCEPVEVMPESMFNLLFNLLVITSKRGLPWGEKIAQSFRYPVGEGHISKQGED